MPRTPDRLRAPDAPGAGVDPHRVVARADAASLLRLVPVPPGAQPSEGRPAGVTTLEQAPSTPGTPDVVDLAAWWTAPGTMGSVIAWVQAHRRP
ncbi:MAG TPA: hypothetical protein VMV22_00320 [Acidimicrobiales bacterium]|nr:hypothetical protein [Acidimicrobiales bacterium]